MLEDATRPGWEGPEKIICRTLDFDTRDISQSLPVIVAIAIKDRAKPVYGHMDIIITCIRQMLYYSLPVLILNSKNTLSCGVVIRHPQPEPASLLRVVILFQKDLCI